MHLNFPSVCSWPFLFFLEAQTLVRQTSPHQPGKPGNRTEAATANSDLGVMLGSFSTPHTQSMSKSVVSILKIFLKLSPPAPPSAASGLAGIILLVS